MDGHSFLAHSDIGAPLVHPGAGVVVLHSVSLQRERRVGVTAENALSVALFCVAERALGYLRRQAQPSGVETVKVAGKPFALGIELLEPEIDKLSEKAQLEVLDGEGIELMAVNRQMALPLVIPAVLLVHGYANQVRHYVRQAMIMVALHPHHFHLVLGVGELADIAQKLPMLLGEAAEVEVGKDVAQQNQAPELDRMQKIQRVRSPADIGAQVQIRNNYRVVVFSAFRPHAPFL